MLPFNTSGEVQRKRSWGFLPLAAALAGLAFASDAAAVEELNALVWCDHTDPALLQPFEDQ